MPPLFIWLVDASLPASKILNFYNNLISFWNRLRSKDTVNVTILGLGQFADSETYPENMYFTKYQLLKSDLWKGEEFCSLWIKPWRSVKWNPFMQWSKEIFLCSELFILCKEIVFFCSWLFFLCKEIDFLCRWVLFLCRKLFFWYIGGLVITSGMVAEVSTTVCGT